MRNVPSLSILSIVDAFDWSTPENPEDTRNRGGSVGLPISVSLSSIESVEYSDSVLSTLSDEELSSSVISRIECVTPVIEAVLCPKPAAMTPNPRSSGWGLKCMSCCTVFSGE